MLITGVLVFAGCGGGSSRKSSGTSSAGPGSPAVVSAKHGGFSTIIPRGYVPEESTAEYWATGPRTGESATTLLVLRKPAQEGDIRTVARKTQRAARRVLKAIHISPLRPLSVGGEPALSLDYVVKPSRKETRFAQHVTLVFVRHGEWVYFIRDFAPPTIYPAAASTLGEVIREWHWL